MFRVLYLFAGQKRRADMRTYLIKYCKDAHIKLIMTEIDVVRQGQRVTC